MNYTIDMLAEVKESIINAYVIKTGLTRAKLSHLMDAETWMDANKAVELGFADDIIQRAETKPNKEDPDEEDPDEESTEENDKKPTDSMLFSRKAVNNALMNKLEKHYVQPKQTVTKQAEQIDVVPATILMYERNKHPIPFDVANSLADALDVNADLLYDDFAVFLVTPYSEALKDIRMSIGMSQRAFAEHIGVIPSYYYKLESGHRRPSRKVYQRMVDTLSHTHPHHSLFAQHKLQSK